MSFIIRALAEQIRFVDFQHKKKKICERKKNKNCFSDTFCGESFFFFFVKQKRCHG